MFNKCRFLCQDTCSIHHSSISKQQNIVNKFQHCSKRCFLILDPCSKEADVSQTRPLFFIKQNFRCHISCKIFFTTAATYYCFLIVVLYLRRNTDYELYILKKNMFYGLSKCILATLCVVWFHQYKYDTSSIIQECPFLKFPFYTMELPSMLAQLPRFIRYIFRSNCVIIYSRLVLQKDK